MDYKKAGVDIEAGYKSVELMKEHVKRTMREEVLGGLGGFSGAFSLKKIKDMDDPVLLSGTDGCGTKVKLAMILDKHDTIGIDAVAMCVNDIACAGGEPLFFLDYIACGKNYPEKIAEIVSGVAEGCVQSDAALIGGETAEHPGLMPEEDYDLAGFAVGVCDRKDLITGENLKDGDVLIGMASTGVHSNGFSLVRKVFDMSKESLNTYYDELGKTLGEALLAPTKIYVKTLKEIKNGKFKRVAQTASYIPHFISVVVICSMLNRFGSLNGLFNDVRALFGMSRVDMNSGDTYFLLEYIGSAVWQGVGWGSIIYLSALSNIDTSLYDVANLDGANRLQKIRHIAWPTIMPTSATLLIMNAGSVMNADFQKILLMQNTTNTSKLEVLATFVYHQGIESGEFSYSTAVNLFSSVICLILVWGTNMIVRRTSPENSLW